MKFLKKIRLGCLWTLTGGITIFLLFSFRCCYWNVLPFDAATQISRIVKSRGEVMMIPLLEIQSGVITDSGDNVVVLGEPKLFHHPFSGIADAFSSNEIGFTSPGCAVGKSQSVLAFLLLTSDGDVYDVDVQDYPRTTRYNLTFYRADLSSAWQSELMQCTVDPEWQSAEKQFWNLKSIAGLHQKKFRWEHLARSMPVVAAFLKKHPPANRYGNGKWVYVSRNEDVPDSPEHKNAGVPQ